MLYHLFEYLQNLGYDFPGIRLMHYISFRSVCCAFMAILTAWILGDKTINFLRRKQIGENVRTLGLEGELQKKGTPTMGGIIIIVSILVPVLLFCDLSNTNILLLTVTTLWLGLLGFTDDYIKVFKKNKDGLSPKAKLIAQLALGLAVGLTLYLTSSNGTSYSHTTIPFFKGNEFDYKWLVPGSGPVIRAIQGGLYVIIIAFIITACSNGTNLADGMDGMTAGISAVVGATLGILAYLSGHTGYAEYLNIMFLPDVGEISVYTCAFVGALLGFLWYNCFPAQVFMGDTGSLALGGIIGVLAVLIRKELLLPILCGIFLVESISVMIQRFYFKYTKKKTGTGVRVFRMAPLHHHFQKTNPDAILQHPARIQPENRIVVRFWIVSIILAVFTVITLKIR